MQQETQDEVTISARVARRGDRLMATAGNGNEYVRQLTAALAVASIGILTAGCSSGSNQGIETSTTTTTTAPPLADTALPGLLLSPEQVNTAMGATEMTVTKPTSRCLTTAPRWSPGSA